jgi:hypothetical protein
VATHGAREHWGPRRWPAHQHPFASTHRHTCTRCSTKPPITRYYCTDCELCSTPRTQHGGAGRGRPAHRTRTSTPTAQPSAPTHSTPARQGNQPPLPAAESRPSTTTPRPRQQLPAGLHQAAERVGTRQLGIAVGKPAEGTSGRLVSRCQTRNGGARGATTRRKRDCSRAGSSHCALVGGSP